MPVLHQQVAGVVDAHEPGAVLAVDGVLDVAPPALAVAVQRAAGAACEGQSRDVRDEEGLLHAPPRLRKKAHSTRH